MRLIDEVSMKRNLILPFLACPMFIGCASITQGTTQSLVFNLDPEETKCSVTREGEGEIGSISAKNNTLSVELLAKRRIEEWCAATRAVFTPFLTVASVIRPLN